jgi:NAD(P)-dependent dehydrogenase (short-subunit alcohol dehydrogenase family)
MASLFYLLNDLVQGLRGTNTTFLTDKEVPGADLTGKWIIITGANNGIGFEAAKSFARWGANIILGCREPPEWEQHPTAAVKECNEIAQAHGHSSTIEWWPVDMADLETVEAFAQRWIATGNPLDILCNNAGIAVAPLNAKTKDGFHPVHQVFHLFCSWNIRDTVLTNHPD